jgi:hypothetical protein
MASLGTKSREPCSHAADPIWLGLMRRGRDACLRCWILLRECGSQQFQYHRTGNVHSYLGQIGQKIIEWILAVSAVGCSS